MEQEKSPLDCLPQSFRTKLALSFVAIAVGAFFLGYTFKKK